MNKIKKIINDLIARKLNLSTGEVSLLNARSGFVTPRTDLEALRALIRALHPVTDHHLEMIRLGPAGDGGYLVPDDLAGMEACFSPGVSAISGFEKDCADRGMKVFMADRSVDQPAETHELFHFTKKYVGALSNDDFLTLDDWIASSLSGKDSDLLLQMDIEGAEYEALLSLSERLLDRFRIIVIEFHSLDQLWNQLFFQMASRGFEKILQTHACVHIHPNNYARTVKKQGLDIPEMMEFTFLRKDRIKNACFSSAFPHHLDSDNTSGPSLALPQCWYRDENPEERG